MTNLNSVRRRLVCSRYCTISLFLLPALFLLLTLRVAPNALAAGSSIQVRAGSGSFVFVDDKGNSAKKMTVYTYLPVGIEPAKAKIVFVMHGVSKNASGYRDAWIEHADKHGFMVVAPLFDTDQWGNGEYARPKVIAAQGELAGAASSFNVVEHLFDAIKQATRNKSSTYFLYGHSEGGQFVHRLVLLLPDARYEKAIAANPGWYTMPVFDSKFPYGLVGSAVTEESLKKSFARKLVLLLGDLDTDTDHKNLRRTTQAMAQGANRLERGRNFMKLAGSKATALNTQLNWEYEIVRGAAHQNGKMSAAAAAVFMAR